MKTFALKSSNLFTSLCKYTILHYFTDAIKILPFDLNCTATVYNLE